MMSEALEIRAKRVEEIAEMAEVIAESYQRDVIVKEAVLHFEDTEEMPDWYDFDIDRRILIAKINHAFIRGIG